MGKNILITPTPTGSTNPSIAFSGATGKMITLEILSGGTLAFNSSGGTMLSIDDSTTGSLQSVNDISGLPIFEVFSDDRVVAGKYNTNAFVVSGTNVGFGTATPSARVDIRGIGADSNLAFSISSSAGTPYVYILNNGNSSFAIVSATTYYSGATLLETAINNIVDSQGDVVFQVTSSTALTEINQTVIVNSTSATTISLPQITRDNVKITIKNINTGMETVLPFGSQTIDGDSNFVTERQNTSLDLKSFNLNWIIY